MWTGINFNIWHETKPLKPKKKHTNFHKNKEKNNDFRLDNVSYSEVKTNHGKQVS